MNILDRPELVDRLAAAYALGTLRGGARRRFEALARQSPAARGRVIVWQENFAVMTVLQPAVQPSPVTWSRIQGAIQQSDTSHQVSAGTQQSTMLHRLRRSLALWRGFTAAAAFAALAAIAVSVQLSLRPQIQYVAVLQDNQQQASMLVTFDPAKKTLTLKRVASFEEGPDRSLQLWALLPNQAPRSLGVLQGKPVVRLVAGAPDVTGAPALAISLEPKGGAPAGGGPTGPVLFKGTLLRTAI